MWIEPALTSAKDGPATVEYYYAGRSSKPSHVRFFLYHPGFQIPQGGTIVGLSYLYYIYIYV